MRVVNSTVGSIGPEREVQLTRVQRSLVASHQRHSEFGHQNAALVVHLLSGIDTARLIDAFETVVNCVEILRLRLAPETTWGAVIVDGVPTSTSIRQQPFTEFKEWAEKRATQPIDLEKSCYESCVAEHDDGSASWYINLHHIINDWSSAALVLTEVEKAYLGHKVSKQNYFDHEIDAQGSGGSNPFWEQRQPANQINRLYNDVSYDSAAASQVEVEFDPEFESLWYKSLTEKFRLLTPQLTNAAFIVFSTALYAHRMSGEEHFSVGVVVNHREKSKTTQLIGPGFDMFPVDVRILEHDTYIALFKRIASELMETLKNAVPGTSPASDFNTVVNILPESVAPNEFAGQPSTISWLHSGSIDGTYVLRVMSSPYAPLVKKPGKPRTQPALLLDIKDDALGAVKADQASKHFKILVADALANPDNTIGSVSLLEPERHAELPLSGPPISRSNKSTLNSMLEKALKDNNNIVLVQGNEQLSGQQLWDWSCAIAADLSDYTNTDEKRVGLLLDTSMQAVAAVFGSVLAGWSFVPLDTDDPKHRTKQLLNRANLKRVFIKPGEIDALRPTNEKKTTFKAPKIKGSNEAYLLFTSGSSGEPKGVPITRDGLKDYLNHVKNCYFRDVENPVAPLFGSLKFDLTITTLFAPIMNGGAIHTFPGPARIALAEIVRVDTINWMKATPSHLKILLKLLGESTGISTLIVGGEAFSSKLAFELFAKNQGLSIYNEYGPTEAVVGCVVHKITNTSKLVGSEVPIGLPIEDTSLLLMDTYNKPVPFGAAGELWISHSGVMNGYLDGEDPKGSISEFEGKSYYRSGDLSRLNGNGELEFLGRIDSQMKLNGVRVDPVEVEHALTNHPNVESAVVRVLTPKNLKPKIHCTRCGLPDNVPNVAIDEAGICQSCHAYESVKDVASSWFGNPQDFQNIIHGANQHGKSKFDCMHLLSGGKDSTFALYKLVEMGVTPYVLTLDNGYISPSAKENIDRVIEHLGLEHEYATPASMQEIFKDSLRRHSNVCNGCFKSIYSMATAHADNLGIKVIVTGLSRGQLFETRLMPQQFEAGRFNGRTIDRAVLEARKVYHRTQDACSSMPETSVFDDETVFDRIHYVDFYRYFDVELATMLSYLNTKTSWKRPADTGRSTNCLINEMGIYTHLKEQGFHNYAIPYAWDVRLGNKTRDEAIAELQDELDPLKMNQMLSEIDYVPKERAVLTAWYVSRSSHIPDNELHTYLARRLPAYALPTSFVNIDEIPLTKNGKLDDEALPAPKQRYRPRTDFLVSAENETERKIVQIWERELGLSPIGRDDDFFALGGDSLSAIRSILAMSAEFDLGVSEEFAFTHTTPAKLASLLENIGPYSQRDDGHNSLEPTVLTYDDENPPALSVGEQAILFEHRSQPQSLRYNASRIYWIDGDMDFAKFEDAWREVIALHVPLQWTYAASRKQIEPKNLIDLSVDEEPKSNALIEEQFRSIIDTPFNLESGPLVRFAVHTAEGKRTAVLLVIHHIACDHESFDVLWQQAAQYYETGILPEIQWDYASFASSHASQNAAKDKKFWLEQDMSSAAELKQFAPDINNQVDGYISLPLEIDPDDLSQGHRSPLAARGMAAATISMKPFMEGELIDISLLMTGRQNTSAKNLVGYLLNPVPYQISCQANQTINQVVEDTHQQLAKTIPHSNYPFPLVHSDRKSAGLAPPKSRFLLSIVEHDHLDFNGLSVQQELVTNRDAVTDATFFVQKTSTGLELSLEYKREVFGDDIAKTILENFRDTMEQIHTNPHVPIASRVNGNEAASVLYGQPLEKFSIVYDQIVEHMQNQPDRIAIECGSETFTWEELRKCSAHLAGELKKQKVGRDALIAIALPRSPVFIAAILAIHSLGAAYVPLDLSNTKSRIDDVLSVSNPQAVLHASFEGDLENGIDLNDLGIREERWRRTRRKLAPKLPLVDATAYVIFTSGSTGEPKGVPITHRQLAHSNSARALVYDASPESFLLLSSFAFDSSVVGIFWTLSAGGSLVTLNDEDIHDPDQLIRVMKETDFSHTLCVPTLYNMMLQRQKSIAGHHWPKTVILAGEALSPIIAAKHFEQFPDNALVNEYGPTEASIWSLSHAVCAGDNQSIPIGKPIPGTWAAIVGNDNQPVAHGVVGELVLGGPNISHGYLNKETHTQTRFLDGSDFNLQPGRVFQTGDKAVLKNGDIFFLGRMDDQLNIGGMRVEPGEIERAICAQPGVRDAVVFTHDPGSVEDLTATLTPVQQQSCFAQSARSQTPAESLRGILLKQVQPDGKLFAHVEANTDLDLASLRNGLNKALPPLLIPSNFEIHETFPVTSTGKVDRKKLRTKIPAQPKPNNSMSVSKAAVQSSKDLNRLRELFVKILENPGFQSTDSFFVFGGNSLTAFHLIFEIETLFDTQVSTSALYKNPSPEKMLTHLMKKGVVADISVAPHTNETAKPRKKTSQSFALPIQLEGTKPPIVAIHTLGVNGQIFADLATALGPDQPFWGVGENAFINMYGGWVSDPNGPTAVVDVVRGYVEEIEDLVPDGPIILAGFCLGAQYAYELAQQLTAKGRQPALLIMLHDRHAPEWVRRSQSELQFARASRWAQIKEKKLASIPRAIKKAPELLNRSILEMNRQLEIKLLARSKRLGKPLTKRLSERDFIERSYIAAHAYENLPYDGDVVIVRRPDRSVYPELSENNAWGNRLSNVEVFEIETDAFKSFLGEPYSEPIAKIIESAIGEHTAGLSNTQTISSESASEIFASDNLIEELEDLNLSYAKGNSDHQIRLSITDDTYIRSPRSEQRDWLITQRLQELSEELDHLHVAAPKMVAATGNLVVEGRDQAKLMPDEIMEDWLIPLMKEMAKIAAQARGDVLEIGFGRGISAAMIQDWKPKSHTIIEVNEHVVDDFQNWLKDYPGRDIKMVKGLWQDVIDELDKYDGLLFHTYPLSAEEMVGILSNSCTFAEHFFPVAAKLLKPGGSFTYFTNDANSISRTHQRALLDNFESFKIGHITDLEISKNSADAQWFGEIVTIEAFAK